MSAKSSKGLGKGFDVLIPTNFDNTLLIDAQDRVQKLFISHIQPNPEQPRRSFDKQALEELASSIKRYGVLQPIIVSPDKSDSYILVAGERRWRAAQIAGLEHIPAIVRERKELEQLEVALIENVQRVDLSPLEQAISIERLHQQFNVSYTDIAVRLGKALSTVHNIVRLLQLPEKARDALQKSEITEGHARAILALKDQPTRQTVLLEGILQNRWSVRQAEQFVINEKHAKKAGNKPATVTNQTPETKRLAQRLGTDVTLKHLAHGGRLEIHYKDQSELDKLIRQLLT